MNKKHLALIFIILCMDMMGIGILVPIAPQLFDVKGPYFLLEQGTSQSIAFIWLGLLLFIYPLFQFFSAPVLGEISDFLGRKKVLTICLFGTFCANLLTVVGLSYGFLWLILFSRAIDGITGGNMAVLTASAADVTEQKSRTKIFGIIGAAFGLSMILSPLIGALLVHFSIILPFIFVSCVSFVNILFVRAYFKETVFDKEHLFSLDKVHVFKSVSNIIEGFTHPVLGKLFRVQVFFSSAFGFFTSFLAAYLLHRFNYSTLEIAYYFLYIGIINIVIQGFIVPRIAGKVSDRSVLKISLPFAAGIMLLYPLISTSFLFLIATPFFALASSFSNSNLSGAISARTSNDVQGKIQGISSSVSGMSYAIPQLLSGFVAGVLGFKGPFFIAGIMYAVSAIVFYVYKDKINNL